MASLLEDGAYLDLGSACVVEIVSGSDLRCHSISTSRAGWSDCGSVHMPTCGEDQLVSGDGANQPELVCTAVEERSVRKASFCVTTDTARRPAQRLTNSLCLGFTNDVASVKSAHENGRSELEIWTFG